MASLAALQSRVAALEALVEERDARIAALEKAVQTLTVGGAGEPELEWTAKKVREAFIEVRGCRAHRWCAVGIMTWIMTTALAAPRCRRRPQKIALQPTLARPPLALPW